MHSAPEILMRTSSFQITWARLEDEYRPYSVLTIGDTNYLEDKRYIVSKPLTHKEVSNLISLTCNIHAASNTKEPFPLIGLTIHAPCC